MSSSEGRQRHESLGRQDAAAEAMRENVALTVFLLRNAASNLSTSVVDLERDPSARSLYESFIAAVGRRSLTQVPGTRDWSREQLRLLLPLAYLAWSEPPSDTSTAVAGDESAYAQAIQRLNWQSFPRGILTPVLAHYHYSRVNRLLSTYQEQLGAAGGFLREPGWASTFQPLQEAALRLLDDIEVAVGDEFRSQGLPQITAQVRNAETPHELFDAVREIVLPLDSAQGNQKSRSVVEQVSNGRSIINYVPASVTTPQRPIVPPGHPSLSLRAAIHKLTP